MDIRSAVQSLKVRAVATRVDSNPNMVADDWARYASHWKVTLKHNGRRMTVPFSQGSAFRNPPSAEDVLNCLTVDAISVENARGVEDWARDLGYDPDSKVAVKTYNLCMRQRKRLLNFLGNEGYRALCEADPL